MRKYSEAFHIAARQASEPIRPGMGVKAQINAACENLGYERGYWRVREAWYGEDVDWGCSAGFDFIVRYQKLRKREPELFAGKHNPFNFLFETMDG